MQATLEFLATFCCAIFAGAAIYINAVEHPARMSCGTSAALAEWAPSYTRATIHGRLRLRVLHRRLAGRRGIPVSRCGRHPRPGGPLHPHHHQADQHAPPGPRPEARPRPRCNAPRALEQAAPGEKCAERAGPRSAALAALIVAYVPRFPTTISRVDARFWGIGVVTRARGSTGNRGRITPQLERSPMPRPRSRAVRRDGPRVPARGPRAPR